jgi:hypothetical protein
MYPYVIPFSGAAMAADPALRAFTVYERRQVAGTQITWDQPSKILPMDPSVRETILRIERDFEELLGQLQPRAAHLPSRVRSLIWILCSLRTMAAQGLPIAEEQEVCSELTARLPQAKRAAAGPAVATA